MSPDIFEDIEILIIIAAVLAAVLNWDLIQASLQAGKDRGKL